MSEITEIDIVKGTKEDQIGNSSDDILNEQTKCHPCSILNKTAYAIKYCNECEENLCDKCVESHVKRKATSTHKPIPFDDMKKARTFNCCPCVEFNKVSNAVTYCDDCEEYLCTLCTHSHKNRKATRLHEPIAVELLKDQARQSDEIVPLCDSCKDNNIDSFSLNYCEDCEEYLCEPCTKSHKSRKATKSHVPVPISSMRQKVNKEVNDNDRKLCVQCLIVDHKKEAKSFCVDCEELLCDGCTKQHRSKQLTKAHTLEGPESVEYVTRYCEICDLEKEADVFCNVCKEALCQICAQKHVKSNASKSHSTEHVESKTLKRVFFCDLCKEHDEFRKSQSFCNTCEENYCETCTRQHKTQKMTKLHELTKPGLALTASKQELAKTNHKVGDIDAAQNTNAKICDQCEDGQVTNKHCSECQLYLCGDCSERHHRGRFTQTHILLEIVKSKEQDCDTCKTLGAAQFFCEQCKEFFCSFCNKQHQSLPVNSQHQLVSVKEGMKKRMTEKGANNNKGLSEGSDKVETSDSPASRIVEFSTEIEIGKPSPTKYALPITEVRQARNERAKTKKFEVGTLTSKNVKSKTIMLVGSTGTGKSTLVDGIVNYVLGVNWDDPFRFTVIDLEQEEKDRVTNQALSQTEWITCYTLNPEKGSRLKYQLHIIDTPGFGDTRGLQRDQEIVEQIRQLFSKREPKGVTFIDSVCFLIKAPDARLTPVQKYIFQSIMSLFGRDIENNICSLVTFADGFEPPVLAALKESGLPFGKCFTFNNSGLFARNLEISSSSLAPMFWDMGLKSFQAFFDHVEQVETKSLQLTKEVLIERSRLEATVKNLQPQLDKGLTKVNCLNQEIEIIEKNKSLIKDNEDFEYVVDEIHQKTKALPRGVHVTNCTECHFTCHDNCVFENNDDKAKCRAMDETGNCKICPDNCHWTKHANTSYIFEYETVKVTKTYADMQQKYREATGKLLSQEQIVEKLGEELQVFMDGICKMMVIIKSCNERLEEIALTRPTPLSMTEYIDVMIENEKLEMNQGFIERIKVLNEFRKQAEIPKRFEKLNTEAQFALGAVGKNKKKDSKAVLVRLMNLFNIRNA